MFVILCDIIDEFKMWFLWQITKRDSNSDGGKKIAFAQRAKATQQNHYITPNMRL